MRKIKMEHYTIILCASMWLLFLLITGSAQRVDSSNMWEFIGSWVAGTIFVLLNVLFSFKIGIFAIIGTLITMLLSVYLFAYIIDPNVVFGAVIVITILFFVLVLGPSHIALMVVNNKSKNNQHDS